jgi:hypothetical protein
MNERCPYCQANLKKFYHTLTPGIVSVLIAAIQFVHGAGRNEFHLQNDLHLSVNQFCNVTKLRFHALIAKVDGKPGYWCITKRGGMFLRGEICVPLKVKTFRNRVEDHSAETIHIDDLRGKVPYFEREFAYETAQVEAPKETANTLF